MSFFERFRKERAVPSPQPELSPSEHTPSLVARCLDQLVLLYPEGWRDLEICAHVDNDGTAMRIDRVDVTPVASSESIPEFPDDARARTALLAAALLYRRRAPTSASRAGNALLKLWMVSRLPPERRPPCFT